MDPTQFIESMSRWSKLFSADADKPIIGASEAELRAMTTPALIVPGNDRIHSRSVCENLAHLLPDSELHVFFPYQVDADMSPNEEWAAKEGEIAALIGDFIRRAKP